MSVISLQDIYFIIMLFAALISLAGAIIFYSAFKLENALQASWRGIGFGFISLASLCAIVQLKWPFLFEVQLFLEAIGFVGIYRGMTIDPYVSYLQDASSAQFDKAVDQGMLENRKSNWVRRGLSQFSQVNDPDSTTFFLLGCALIFSIIFYIAGSNVLLRGTSFIFLLISLLYVMRTLILQIYRLVSEKAGHKIHLSNLWPLIAYIFFSIRISTLILSLIPAWLPFFTLPLDVQALSNMSLFATFGGLMCIAFWLRPFIRSRAPVQSTILIVSFAALIAAIFFVVLN